MNDNRKTYFKQFTLEQLQAFREQDFTMSEKREMIAEANLEEWEKRLATARHCEGKSINFIATCEVNKSYACCINRLQRIHDKLIEALLVIINS